MSTDTRPRVVLVNRVYPPSGAATAQLLADLAEGLAARGWPVHVVAAGPGPVESAGVQLHLSSPEPAARSGAARIAGDWRFLRFARRTLAGLVRPGDRVVLLTDPPLLAQAATGIAHDRGAVVVHWIQDIYPEIARAHFGLFSALPFWPLRLARNRAWRRATLCLPVCDDQADWVRAQGVSTVRVLPNWAPRELAVTPDPALVAAQRAAWGLTDRFVVAYSGNFGRVHEFVTVLAAADLLRTIPDLAFLFVGAGPRQAAVVAAARRLALPQVHFRPPVPRTALAVALAAADVHLVTLRSTGTRFVHPSKLAGALAAGRPVLSVGAPAGSTAALLAADACGFTVAPGDAAGLAALIRRLRADPNLTTALGQRARASYTRRFTLAQALERWEALLCPPSPGDRSASMNAPTPALPGL